MDLNELLDLKPEELADKILERRQFLSQALPEIEARMAADADDLAPKVEKLRLARDASSAGDRIAAENYMQHAEHYLRISNAIKEKKLDN